MAKPKPNNDEAVSLFPFLSILACLIGVLTFIITGVAISQMDQSDAIADAERAQKYAPVAEQLEADRQRLAELKQARRAADAMNQRLAEAAAELKRLSELKADAQRAAKAKQLMGQIAQKDQQIERFRPELAKLRTQVEQTRAEIAERNNGPEPAGTVVRPGGSGVDLDPNFIECQSTQIILHIDGKQHAVARGRLRADKALLALLDRVAPLKSQRIIFLVRPDAVSTYNAAAAIARERQCRYGKLPVPGEGPIDLSPFKKK